MYYKVFRKVRRAKPKTISKIGNAQNQIKMTEFARFLFENKETNFRVFTILRLYAIEMAELQRQVFCFGTDR